MRTLLIVSLILGSWPPRGASAQDYGPADAPIEIGDIARFWQAWDRLPAAATFDDTLRLVREVYFAPGSPGLQDFIRARIENAEALVAQIRRYPRYYASIREPTSRMAGFVPAIREVFTRWAALVPEARFPAVYLVTGGHINAGVHAWAEPRAAVLWRDFLAVKDTVDNAGWLYAKRADGEPNDLGYWIGYRIAKAYYDRAADKGRAIRAMLAIEDFDAFLVASGIEDQLGGP